MKISDYASFTLFPSENLIRGSESYWEGCTELLVLFFLHCSLDAHIGHNVGKLQTFAEVAGVAITGGV
jgi:hypothetical protein